ncbi:MAG: bifunctional nuclease family protein [Acidimicrobiales bacterium]
MTVEMELVGVRVQMPTNAPILLLREAEGQRRTVPIYIGGPEAHAIDLALSATPTARPMTHDLFAAVVDGLSATFDRVVLTEMREGTYYAELFIETAAGDAVSFSCRPSDAIALAARAEIPIFAEESLIDEAGIVEVEDDGEAEEDEMVEELRRFLDDVTPEDFK